MTFDNYFEKKKTPPTIEMSCKQKAVFMKIAREHLNHFHDLCVVAGLDPNEVVSLDLEIEQAKNDYR